MLFAIAVSTVAKLLDPLLLIAAFAFVYPVRRWWVIFVVGLVLGILYEMFLMSVAGGRQIVAFPLSVLPASAAATAYAGLGYVLFWSIRKAALPKRQPMRGLVIGALCVVALFAVIAPGAVLSTYVR